MLTLSPGLARIGDALGRAEQHWNARHRSQPSEVLAPFTIALSREAGTPGTSLAREVGRRLDWPVYDHELVEQIAGQLGVHACLLDSVDERRKSWLLQCLEAFGPAPISECGYAKRLREALAALAAHGRCVIVGRGAPSLLPAKTTLRVRLIAPLEDRIAWVCEQRKCSRDAALRWIHETDRDRLEFVRTHFFTDAGDPRNYDLLINPFLYPMSQAADQIIAALHAAESRTSEAAE